MLSIPKQVKMGHWPNIYMSNPNVYIKIRYYSPSVYICFIQITTFKVCRSIWYPTISNWDAHDAWVVASGSSCESSFCYLLPMTVLLETILDFFIPSIYL